MVESLNRKSKNTDSINEMLIKDIDDYKHQLICLEQDKNQSHNEINAKLESTLKDNMNLNQKIIDLNKNHDFQINQIQSN